ncbi:hypothetical protein B566_EDAN011740 [Ephemera danica]|nr:hypothetical protein B566_EDAN011740 [Ephemera danica]
MSRSGVPSSVIQNQLARKNLRFRLNQKVIHFTKLLGKVLFYCAKHKDFLSLHSEPMGSKVPTFPSEFKSYTMVKSLEQGFVMLCQAQGFPVPSFRIFFSEPVGSKAPTFPTEAKSITYLKMQGLAMVLLCQAQGFPVPAFRYAHQPVGSKAPTFSTEAKSSTYIKTQGLGIVLLCQAQGFPVPAFSGVSQQFLKLFSEPVGSKAPAFSTDSKGSIFVRSQGQGFSLLCPAQGFPVPAFRYDQIIECPTIEKKDQKHRHFQLTRKAVHLLERKDKVSVYYVKHKGFRYLLLEPMSRMRPNFPKTAKSNSFEAVNGFRYSLLCEAQGFPPPSFRTNG